jgi:hypothetical protein
VQQILAALDRLLNHHQGIPQLFGDVMVAAWKGGHVLPQINSVKTGCWDLIVVHLSQITTDFSSSREYPHLFK